MIHSFDVEKKEQELAKRLIKHGMTVFDVGANIGHFTMLYRDLVGPSGKIYSFEPTKNIFGKLQMNASANNIHLINMALYSSSSFNRFYEFEQGFEAFNSLRIPETDHKPVRDVIIQTMTLDDFCEQNKISAIDFIKIDTEGAELEIFKGAERILKEKRIHYMQFEISQAFLKGFRLEARQVFDHLQNIGYECRIINQDGGIGAEVYNTDAYQDNFLAFSKGMINE